MGPRRKGLRRAVTSTAGILVTGALALTGCASSSGDTDSGAATATESAASSPAASEEGDTAAGGTLEAFQAKVKEEFDKATVVGDAAGLAVSEDVPLQEGASVGAACLGSQLTACGLWWDELAKVSAVTGWEIAQYDGKLDLKTWNEELTRAAQAGHDGILVFGGVPSLSTEGMKAIADAGVPVVGMTTDDPEGVTAVGSRLDGGIEKDNFEIGYLQGVAAYTIGNGKVHAIGGYDGSDLSNARQRGFEAFIKECADAGGDCKADLRQTDTAQMYTQIGQYCPSLAQANPDFNVMTTQADDITTICVDAVKAAGLLKDGDFGVSVDFNSGASRIAEGTDFLASVAVPYTSGAWQGADELNRLMQGLEPLEGRPWVKQIFYPGNIATVDTASGTAWDVQLFSPEEFYRAIWGQS